MNKVNKIGIYGSGIYGINIFYELKKRGIKIDYFADRDKSKCGYALEGINCISYDTLSEFDKKKTVVIIGVKGSEQKLKSLFSKQGFLYVFDAKQVIDMSPKKIEQKDSKIIQDISYLKILNNELCEGIYNNKSELFDSELQQIVIDYQKRNMQNENIRSKL